MARYEAGETLSSIARTYGCSPPAISYVVSRSRARHAIGGLSPTTSTPPLPEVQLVKSGAGENGHAVVSAPAADSSQASSPPQQNLPSNGSWVQPQRSDDDRPPVGNGFAGFRSSAAGAQHAVGPQPPQSGHPNGDHRKTLHLSLGNGGQPAESRHQTPEHQPNSNGHGNDLAAERMGPQPVPAAADGARLANAPAGNGGNGASASNGGDGAGREARGSGYIDSELRARVDSDITAFLSAFDAALSEDSQESRAALREATDRLLRAGARTRIELERLEARMPLPRRDAAMQSAPAWRPR